MNKKIKVLSSVICGLALSSSLALTNVQAAPAKISHNNGISIKSIIANDTYSKYCTLSNQACNDIYHYIKDNNGSATANGLRNLLVQKGYLSRTQANTVALSLFSLATETTKGGFPETGINGVSILQPNKQQGAFNVVGYHSDQQINGYYVYAVLNSSDTKTIKSYVDLNGVVSDEKLADFLINNGITSDYTSAIYIARAIESVDYKDFDDLADTGKNILVLADNNNHPYYHLAREAR